MVSVQRKIFIKLCHALFTSFFKILSWFSEDVKKENIKFIRKQNSFVVVKSNIQRQRKMFLERKVACKKRQEDAWSDTRLGLGGAGERG